MSIEKEIFKKSIIDYNKLINYGFKKDKKEYIYETNFLDDSMKAIIVITNDNITGKVIDLTTNYEYTNYRLENITGEFVNSVKEAYENILKDIKNNCTHEELFSLPQTNRITNIIKEKYHVNPEFLWEEYPDFGIFRNTRSHKWFSLIMNVDKAKIIKKSTGNIDIMNVKLDNETTNYLKIPGIYPAYHMNKASWVTIILDDTLSDEYIMKLVDISYDLNNVLGEWLVPANPKYFDIINAFNNTDTIMWKQSNNILKDDTVYIYVAAPYSRIMYKCMAIEVDIPYDYNDGFVSMNKVMKLKLLKRYNDEYTIDKLSSYGIKSIRGPRSISKELQAYLNK